MYQAHHALIAALPAVVPAFVIAAVVAFLATRDRRP